MSLHLRGVIDAVILDFLGGRRDSDPQHLAPQASTLPLSYDHLVKAQLWRLHFDKSKIRLYAGFSSQISYRNLFKTNSKKHKRIRVF